VLGAGRHVLPRKGWSWVLALLSNRAILPVCTCPNMLRRRCRCCPEQEATPRAQRLLTAVEAAAVALHLMTVPDMPQRGARCWWKETVAFWVLACCRAGLWVLARCGAATAMHKIGAAVGLVRLS
jgi:hypothetical protein